MNASHDNAYGYFWESCFRAPRGLQTPPTVLAVGQQRVANCTKFWPQDEHQTMYAIRLLKHVVVVLSNSEGPQKWLASCGADVHRVAGAIDVFLLQQEPRRLKNDNAKWCILSTKHGIF
jgi:hypothetical protein